MATTFTPTYYTADQVGEMSPTERENAVGAVLQQLLRQMEQARPIINGLEDAAVPLATGSVVQHATLRIQSANLTDNDGSQVIEAEDEFPVDARSVGSWWELTSAATGGVESAPAVTGAAPPYNMEPAQTLILNVDGGGNTTATFDASAAFDQTGAGPFAFVDGATFDVTIDDGAAQTVTVEAVDVVDIGAVTAAELAAIINAQTTACLASVVGADTRVTSLIRGTDSAVVIDNFSPAASGARTVGNVPPFNLAPGEVLILNVGGLGDVPATFDATAGFFEPVADEPYDLSGGKSWFVIVNGAPEATITFVDGDFAVPAAATAAEVIAVINAQIVGATAAPAFSKFRVTSSNPGSASEVRSNGGTVPWFANPDTLGNGDAANINAVTFNEAKVVIEADIPGVVVTNPGGGMVITTVATGAAASLEVDAATTAAALGFAQATTNGTDSTEDVLNLDGETAGAGDVADIDQVTFDEAKALIEADIAGVTVTQNDDDELVITTNDLGADVSLEVVAHTAAALGLDVQTVSGTDNQTGVVSFGFGAGAENDLYADASNIMTGEGERQGAGVNANPSGQFSLAGKKLRGTVETTGGLGRVSDLEDLDMTLHVLWTVPAAAE